LKTVSHGNLEAGKIQEYAETVYRAMDEIRQLFRDKGTKRIKELAKL